MNDEQAPKQEALEEQPAEEKEQSSPSAKTPKPRFGLVITLAVLVAIILIALGYMTYSSQDPIDDSATNSKTTDEQQAEGQSQDSEDVALEPATSIDEDLERINQELLELESEGDYNDDQLSNSQVGI